MSIHGILARLLPGDRPVVVVECRHCGTTVTPDTTECPDCGTTDSVRFVIPQ